MIFSNSSIFLRIFCSESESACCTCGGGGPTAACGGGGWGGGRLAAGGGGWGAGGGGEPAPGGGPTGDDAWADVEDPLVPPPRRFHSHLAVQEQHEPVNVDKIATTTSSQS